METPNILLIMADQLPAATLGTYGHPVVRSPNIDNLAEQGVVFDRCYCNAPICGASRASMVTGRLPTAIDAFDNATELPASEPTFMHCLQYGGYHTSVSGKLHFVGPDQLHGFEERLTTDIYPSGFNWTPDWKKGVYPNIGTSVRDLSKSGLCTWSLQLDYDEEVHYNALRKLRDLARERSRPFFLCVSYTHPHDPFIINSKYWDLYDDHKIDMPDAPDHPMEEMHPLNQWLQVHHEVDRFPPSEETIRKARHAFYGMVSYFDEKVGELLAELRRLELDRNTVVVVTSDHGEMLGEHGMWYKRTFFDYAVRVPLIVAWPLTWSGGQRVRDNVSLVDLFPTFLDIAGISIIPEINQRLDGKSLVGLLEGRETNWTDEAISEYCGEGVIHAARMLCRDSYKYIYVHEHEPLLFDLETDSNELENLADYPDFQLICQSMQQRLLEDWDPAEIEERVVTSQQVRLMLHRTLTQDRATYWDYQPYCDASETYVRSRDAQETSRERRFPIVD
jgi:choline-sulfatase